MLNSKSVKMLFIGVVASLSLLSSVSRADNLMKSGQWKDPKTGLIWMRCSIGQKWNGRTCIGEAIKLSWHDAMEYPSLFNEQVAFGGHRNWRLPKISELYSIFYCSNGWMRKNSKVIGNLVKRRGAVIRQTIPNGYGGSKSVPSSCEEGSNIPTINQKIFPNTVGSLYWTSSPNKSGGSWVVAFYGGLGSDGRSNSWSIRLVRSGW